MGKARDPVGRCEADRVLTFVVQCALSKEGAI